MSVSSHSLQALSQPPDVWGQTHVGKVREGNEDSIFPDSAAGPFYNPRPETLKSKGQLLIVADGVGGAQSGSEASQWAIRRAVERYYELPGANLGEDLRTSVAHANASLTQYIQSTGRRDSGCTMAAAVIHNSDLYVANVGDSRVYLIRDGQIFQQTVDHTLTQQKLARGLIRPDQVALDSDNNVLTRSLGAVPVVEVDLFGPLGLQPGDVVLLCSDGLTDMVSEADIVRIASGASPRRAAERLIALANKNGGLDNVSTVLARMGGGAAKSHVSVPSVPFPTKTVLIVLGVLLVLAIMALGAFAGWKAFDMGRGQDVTPVSGVVSEETLPGETPAGVQPVPSDAGGMQPTPGAGGAVATSTPRPTSTATFTPKAPPTATLTPTPSATLTPALPTLTATPGSGGNGDDDKNSGPGRD